MSSRKKIEKMMEEKRSEVEHYKIKIKEAEIYIQALQDTLRFLPRVELDAEAASEINLQEGSYAQKIYELLKKENSPLHIRQIMNKLQIPFNNKTRSSVVGSLGPYIRSGRVFVKTAPNTFWLMGIPYSNNDNSELGVV
jgi:hypothetical protein